MGAFQQHCPEAEVRPSSRQSACFARLSHAGDDGPGRINLALLSKLPPDDLSSTIVSIQFHGPESESLGPLLITVNSETVDWTRLRAIPGLQISDWEQRRTVP